MATQDDDIRGPRGVSPEDEKPEGWCEVSCVFPELKVTKKLVGFKLVDVPESGVFHCKFHSRSLELYLECKTKDKKLVKYSYKVQKLPDEILPEQCEVKYKKKLVVLKLKKAEQRSWQREILANGLDQHVEEDGEPVDE